MACTLVACGGTAIVDPAGGVGGSGAATTSPGGSGGTSTTTVPCECASDPDCPVWDDACFYFACEECLCVERPEPAGTPCMMGVCDGNDNCVECLGPGDCLPGESCVEQVCIPVPEALCQEVCSLAEACMGPTPECTPNCIEDLGDCSGAQLDQLAACTPMLTSCNLDGWVNCMMAIGCIGL